MAPSIEEAVVKGELVGLSPAFHPCGKTHISEERTTRVTYAYKGQACDSLVRKDYDLIRDGLALGALEYN
jgi:hypothetical protein